MNILNIENGNSSKKQLFRKISYFILLFGVIELFVGSLIFGIFLFISGNPLYEIQLNKKNIEITGRVIDKFVDYKTKIANKNPLVIKYEFNINNIKYLGKVTSTKLFKEKIGIGDSVEIEYLNENPKISRIKNFSYIIFPIWTYYIPLLIVVCGIIFLIIGFLLLLKKKKILNPYQTNLN